MRVIGLTGKAGAGKDTVAQFILEWCEQNGVRAKREGFADRLKMSAAVALGYDGDDPVEFCNRLKTEGVEVSTPWTTVTGRNYLQRYGTEAHRDVFGENFWVDALLRNSKDEALDVLVVPDCRFDNEALGITTYSDYEDNSGGEVWEVVRPATDVSDAAAGHASESGVSAAYVEITLDNSGDLRSLRALAHLACMTRRIAP